MQSEILAIMKEATVTIPVWELCLAFAAITLCLLLKFNRMGLTMAFLFTFHMGWMFWQKDLMPKSHTYETWAVIYLICGASVLLLTIANIVMHPPEDSD